jgi:hypothetical protein
MDIVTMKWIAVIACATTSALILTVQHYWVGPPLHRLWRYVMGTLAIWLPLTALCLWWQHWMVVAALWITLAMGGTAVILSYAVDAWRALSAKAAAAELNGQTLREAIDARAEKANGGSGQRGG